MTNNPLHINAPRDAKVSNYLFEDMEPFELNQGLLLIELSNGICIDVGWFPENDPQGNFCVRVSKGWEDFSSGMCKTTSEVVEKVERLIERFSPSIVQTSRSTNRKLEICNV